MDLPPVPEKHLPYSAARTYTSDYRGNSVYQRPAEHLLPDTEQFACGTNEKITLSHTDPRAYRVVLRIIHLDDIQNSTVTGIDYHHFRAKINQVNFTIGCGRRGFELRTTRRTYGPFHFSGFWIVFWLQFSKSCFESFLTFLIVPVYLQRNSICLDYPK